MILITVGTIQYDFPRMVDVVKEIADRRINQEKIIVQSGQTVGFEKISGIVVRSFIPQDELWQLMSEARILLMHGGEGSLLDALEWSPFIPIVFPRDPQYGEHVDNYQLEIAREASSRNLCKAVFSKQKAIDEVLHFRAIEKKKIAFKNKALITYLDSLDSL